MWFYGPRPLQGSGTEKALSAESCKLTTLYFVLTSTREWSQTQRLWTPTQGELSSATSGPDPYNSRPSGKTPRERAPSSSPAHTSSRSGRTGETMGFPLHDGLTPWPISLLGKATNGQSRKFLHAPLYETSVPSVLCSLSDPTQLSLQGVISIHRSSTVLLIKPHPPPPHLRHAGCGRPLPVGKMS